MKTDRSLEEIKVARTLYHIKHYRPFSTHYVNLYPSVPNLKQQIIKVVRNGFLVSTIGNEGSYETMVFPVDLENNLEVVPEVLYAGFTETEREALIEHTKAMNMVMRGISSTLECYREFTEKIEDNILSRLREKTNA